MSLLEEMGIFHQIKQAELTTGEKYEYENHVIYATETDPVRREIGDEDLNDFGLIASQRVQEKSLSSQKMSDLVSTLETSGFKISNQTQLAGLARGLSRVSYSDEWTFDIPVGPNKYPFNSPSLPSIFFSQPELQYYRPVDKPSLAQARQVLAVYSKDRHKDRHQKRLLVAYMMDKDWFDLLPKDYLSPQYDPKSMQDLVFQSSETRYGQDRKTVLKDYIKDSRVTRVVTFSASETMTASVGDVREIILFSLLDNPSADSYDSVYSGLMKKYHPEVTVRVLELNAVTKDVEKSTRKELMSLVDDFEDDKSLLFLHNFFPEMVKVASTFDYSFGFYQSTEYAETLERVTGPPRLYDSRLDQLSVTMFLLSVKPDLLTRSHYAVYDKEKSTVLAFSEHLAFPDKVFEDRSLSPPAGILSLSLQACSKKVKTTSRVRVFMGVGVSATVFDIVQPKLDVSMFLTHSPNLKFSPMCSFKRAEFFQHTLVYRGSTVEYPKTCTYIYTTINSRKIFLDYVFPGRTFAQRRQDMAVAGMVLVPLADKPKWEWSLPIDLEDVHLEEDVGVNRKTFLDPFRKLKIRKMLRKVQKTVDISGYSINQQGVLVRDPNGVLVYSRGGDRIKHTPTDDLGRLPHKRKRGKRNMSYLPLLGNHAAVITVIHSVDVPEVSPYFLYDLMEREGIPQPHLQEIFEKICSGSSEEY